MAQQRISEIISSPSFNRADKQIISLSLSLSAFVVFVWVRHSTLLGAKQTSKFLPRGICTDVTQFFLNSVAWHPNHLVFPWEGDWDRGGVGGNQLGKFSENFLESLRLLLRNQKKARSFQLENGCFCYKECCLWELYCLERFLGQRGYLFCRFVELAICIRKSIMELGKL